MCSTGDRPEYRKHIPDAFLAGRTGSRSYPGQEKRHLSTLAELCYLEGPPLAGATDTLNRIIQGGLEKRYHEKVVHFESAERAYSLVNKDDNDTLRSIAIRSGRKLGVEKVIAGTIWRFTERKGNAIAAEYPASVAFSLFLIDVAHGDIIWNGIFNETQKALTEKLSPKPLPMIFPTIAITARTTVKSIKSLLWGMCK